MKQSFFETVIMPGFPLVIEELKKSSDPVLNNEVFIEKYEKTLMKIVQQMRNVFEGNNDRTYCVLNHCDFHVSFYHKGDILYNISTYSQRYQKQKTSI